MEKPLKDALLSGNYTKLTDAGTLYTFSWRHKIELEEGVLVSMNDFKATFKFAAKILIVAQALLNTAQIDK